MSLETLARPYAQAIFDHSEGWGKDLDQMESVIKDSKVQNLINSPDLAYKQKTEAFISLFAGEVEEKTIKFIEVLGDAKRLSLIPDINLEYKKLVAEKNNSTDVKKIRRKYFCNNRRGRFVNGWFSGTKWR